MPVLTGFQMKGEHLITDYVHLVPQWKYILMALGLAWFTCTAVATLSFMVSVLVRSTAASMGIMLAALIAGNLLVQLAPIVDHHQVSGLYQPSADRLFVRGTDSDRRDEPSLFSVRFLPLVGGRTRHRLYRVHPAGCAGMTTVFLSTGDGERFAKLHQRGPCPDAAESGGRNNPLFVKKLFLSFKMRKNNIHPREERRCRWLRRCRCASTNATRWDM